MIVSKAVWVHFIYELISEYFDGKIDKGGKSYIKHLHEVANKAHDLAQAADYSIDDCWKVYQVGLLHDIFEDTPCTEQELLDIGISPQVIEAIKSVTRQPDEEYYFDFIKKVSENKYAKIVKIADLEHNMDITRLKKFGDYEMKRLKKYWYSWKYLKGELTEEKVKKEIGDIK